MINAQNNKVALSIVPKSINGTAENGTGVDTAGFNYAVALIATGSVGADFDSIKVQECDTSGGTYTDISGLSFTTLTSASSGSKLYKAFIPLGGGRKEFIRIAIDPGAGATLVCGIIELWRANQAPNSATERGLVEQLFA